MYLNEKKVKRKQSFHNTIGGILALFIFAGIFGIYNSIFVTQEFGKKLLIIIFDTSLLFFLFYLNYEKVKRLERAIMFNEIFMSDSDGYIPVKELALKAEKDEKTILKEIKKLIEKNIFQDIFLELGENPQVVLMKNVEETEIITEAVNCPYCGATSLRRKGFAAKCEYCGNDIN